MPFLLCLSLCLHRPKQINGMIRADTNHGIDLDKNRIAVTQPIFYIYIMDSFPFSPYLFWDAELTAIDLEKNKTYVIERVITRGQLSDFQKLINLYSEEEIVETLQSVRQLDPKTAHFCSWYFKIPTTQLHVSSFYR
jgi:hypothetical protein